MRAASTPIIRRCWSRGMATSTCLRFVCGARTALADIADGERCRARFPMRDLCASKMRPIGFPTIRRGLRYELTTSSKANSRRKGRTQGSAMNIVLQHVRRGEHPGVFRDLPSDRADLAHSRTRRGRADFRARAIRPHDRRPQDVWKLQYPWLREEKAAIRNFVVDMRRPILVSVSGISFSPKP